MSLTPEREAEIRALMQTGFSTRNTAIRDLIAALDECRREISVIRDENAPIIASRDEALKRAWALEAENADLRRQLDETRRERASWAILAETSKNNALRFMAEIDNLRRERDRGLNWMQDRINEIAQRAEELQRQLDDAQDQLSDARLSCDVLQERAERTEADNAAMLDSLDKAWRFNCYCHELHPDHEKCTACIASNELRAADHPGAPLLARLEAAKRVVEAANLFVNEWNAYSAGRLNVPCLNAIDALTEALDAAKGGAR